MKDEKIPRTRAPERIIDLLMKNTHDIITKNEKMTFSKIQKEIGLSRPVLSQHLKKLQTEGVIEFERHGREKHYKLGKKTPKLFDSKIKIFGSEYHSDQNIYPLLPHLMNNDELITYLTNKVSGLFLFLILKSIETGKNWTDAFNVKKLETITLDTLIPNIIHKEKEPSVVIEISGLRKDDQYKEVHKMLKNKKIRDEFINICKALEEKFPSIVETLEKISGEPFPNEENISSLK